MNGTDRHDPTAHPRRSDGQWTTVPKPEETLGDDGIDLLSSDTAPASALLTRAMGESRRLTIHEHDFDRYRGFDRAQVMRLDAPNGVGGHGGFAVAAQRTDDIAHGLAEILGGEEGMEFGYGFDPRDPQAEADAHEMAHDWLDAHGNDAVAWARETYQVEMTSPADPRRGRAWNEQTLTTYAADLPLHASTDQVVEHADTEQMKALVADLETGRFYSRMVAEAPGFERSHMDRRDALSGRLDMLSLKINRDVLGRQYSAPLASPDEVTDAVAQIEAADPSKRTWQQSQILGDWAELERRNAEVNAIHGTETPLTDALRTLNLAHRASQRRADLPSN